ncbi:MAG TPA: phosphatase PAP2 family protein [Propionicimonas sp.]|nr:phosphatase PAP2 family protein [Propionicimonas sp.]HQD96039.1 phosphatase PAP2 family protein [Propionicimonas sp.]
MSTPPPVAASPVDRALLVTGGVGIAVFTALILASAWVYDAVVDADGVSGLDRPVLDWALGVRTPAAEYWVTAFTNLGKTVPMVILGLILTSLIGWRWRRRTAWVLMLVASAGSVTFTIVSKAMIARARPPLVDAVPPYEDSFSFPSGHTLNSTVVAGMLAYLVVWLSRTLWVRLLAVLGAVLWAGPMGLSRVFLGHHWLTDVMFAWMFGLGWLALLITVHLVVLGVQRGRQDRISQRSAD